MKTGILRNLLSGFDGRVYPLHEYSLRNPARYKGCCVLSALYIMTNSLNFTLNSTGSQWRGFHAFEVLARLGRYCCNVCDFVLLLKQPAMNNVCTKLLFI